jgi:hypothetical protein
MQTLNLAIKDVTVAYRDETYNQNVRHTTVCNFKPPPGDNAGQLKEINTFFNLFLLFFILRLFIFPLLKKQEKWTSSK